ncbi:hypothetical protein DTO045G8_523 [Paecilomyces variotii]|nr:hypothetical protein DTO045G8_523 [Paecilomyces variotii]
MSQATPVRVILRYREQPFQDLNAIINAFFKWRDIQPLDDYYLEVFKVSGINSFTFRDLGEVARKQVYQRSISLE